MRVLSQGRLARRIAQALLVAFLWSMTTMGVGIRPASAQISTRATTAQSIAVVPFENLTICEPETLGAKARALVSDELQTRLMLDVLSSKDVDDAMAELGLRVPLDEPDLVRLATELEVGMVVTGKVTHAEVVTENGQCYAEVTLSVLLFDRAAETTVNGATVTTRSPAAAANAPAEDLIDKALKQAVFQAVQDMKTRPTVTAMVLWAKGGEIFTNSGTRAGITQGMYMVAIRGGQRIATIQITSAEATGSYGKIVSGSPLQTGDHLRAMYKTEQAEPGLFVHRVVSGAKKNSSRIEKVAIAAGVLLGLAAYASQANNAIQGNFQTNNMRVANLANGADLGVSGLMGFAVPIPVAVPDPTDPEADWSLIIDFGVAFAVPGATMLTWSPPAGSQGSRVAGYFGFRDEFPVGAAFPQHDENWILDTWAIPPGVPGAELGHVSLTLNAATGEVIPGRETLVYNPDLQLDENTGEITYNPEYDDWVDSTVTGILNGITWSPTQVDLWWQVIGPEPPETYQYNVLPITIENAGASGTQSWRFVQTGFTTTTSRRVTSVTPPDPPRQAIRVNPSDAAQSVSVTFSNGQSEEFINQVGMYNATIGADEMIVQITRDAGPSHPISFENNVSRTVAPFALNAISTASAAIPFSELETLPGTGTIYWVRIGGRNRADITKPIVWPVTSEIDPHDVLHFDSGWVWWQSTPVKIDTSTSTGTHSVTAMKKDREVLTNSRTGRTRIRRTNEGRELRVPR